MENILEYFKKQFIHKLNTIFIVENLSKDQYSKK